MSGLPCYRKSEPKRGKTDLTAGSVSLSFLCAGPSLIFQCNDLFLGQSPCKPLEAKDMSHCPAHLLQAWYHMWLKFVRARGLSSLLDERKDHKL